MPQNPKLINMARTIELTKSSERLSLLLKMGEAGKIRWKNSLDVNCTWDIEDDQVKLSPLLLITFVENAFKHVSRSKTEKGFVQIDLKQKDRELILLVKNAKYTNIPAIKEKDASGIGLENIKKRLEILYPEKFNLDINETDTIYTISLSIKL